MKRKIYRHDIVQAGLELMFVNGYNATGIKEITDSIQIPKGSFYNHFTNKEEFGLEVVKTYCDNGVKMYENAFLDKNFPPLTRIENFFNRLIKSYEEEMEFKLGCIMGNFSIEMSDVNEKFRELLQEEFDKCEAIIASCVSEAVANGDVKNTIDPDQTAAFILNAWHGAMLRMKTTASRKPLEDCRDLIMNQVLA